MLAMLFCTLIALFLLGGYIYRLDKNREPVKLIIKLFFGGCGAVVIVAALNLFCEPVYIFSSVHWGEVGLIRYFLGIFLGVAFLEEACKWLFLFWISHKSPEFDESFDAIVYGAFVGLGFAFLENLLYAEGIGTAISRSLLAVPGHCCYGVFMGYHLAHAKLAREAGQKAPARKHRLLSIGWPVLLHGAYDFFVTTDSVILILAGCALKVFVVVMAVRLVKREAAANRSITASEED